MPTLKPPDHDLRDLVRGLRTAASTVEAVDLYVSHPRTRATMLRDVERDYAALGFLLVAARAEAAA